MADKAIQYGGQWLKLVDTGDGVTYSYAMTAIPAGGTTSDFGVGGSSVYSVDTTGTVAVTDAPAAGMKLVLDGLVLSTNPGLTVTFEEETSKARILQVITIANTPYTINFPAKVKLSTAAKKLNVVASAAGTVNALVMYHQEA